MKIPCLLLAFCTITCIWTRVPVIKANVLGETEIKSLGPQPFSKEKDTLNAIPPENERDPISITNEELDIKTSDRDLLKYKNIDDENNQLNLTLNLLPSFNNQTSPVFRASGDTTRPAQGTDGKPSVVKKPSGTLYVDSVHIFQDRTSSSLRMAGAPGCKIDEDLDDDDNDDIHQLSGSQFGFPKSIVNKALEDSPFKSVLNALARLHYFFEHQDTDVRDTQNVHPSQRVPAFPEFASPSKNFKNFDDNSDKSYSEINDNNYNVFIPYQSEKRTGTNQIVSNPFTSPGGYQNDFSSFGSNDDNVDKFAPRLLEGSAFSSEVKPSNDNKIGDNNSINNNNNNNNYNNSNNSNNNNDSNNNLINDYEKEEDNNNSNISHIPSTSRKDSSSTKTSILAQENYGIDVHTGKNNFGFQNNNPIQPSNNLFNKYLPDVSGADSWDVATVGGFDNYYNYNNNQRSLPYQGTNKLSGIMKTLFPPKKSENLPEISGLKDLIPTTNPVIKYSDKQKSNVDSPFEFNIKSIFGSLPGSNTGQSRRDSPEFNSALGKGLAGSNNIGLRNVQPDQLPVSIGSNQGGSSGNFGGFGVASTNYIPPSYDNKGGKLKGSGLASDYNEIRFAQYRTRRKKRETSANSPSSRDTCETNHQVLRQYQNHGGACFVVMPEVQEIQFAICSKSPCSGCPVKGGISRCQAVKVPMWVWAYCESGPNAGSVAPDKVHVSVACTCKITYCRQIPLGRS